MEVTCYIFWFFVNLVGGRNSTCLIHTVLDKFGCPRKIEKPEGDILGLLYYSVGSLYGTVRIVVVECVENFIIPVYS